MSDSVRPQRRQPTRLPHPWDSPGKNTGVGCHFLLQCMKVKSQSEVTQSCLTLSDPMDCSLPGSSVHGIFQARVLEWGAIAFFDLVGSGQLICVPSTLSLVPTRISWTEIFKRPWERPWSYWWLCLLVSSFLPGRTALLCLWMFTLAMWLLVAYQFYGFPVEALHHFHHIPFPRRQWLCSVYQTGGSDMNVWITVVGRTLWWAGLTWAMSKNNAFVVISHWDFIQPQYNLNILTNTGKVYLDLPFRFIFHPRGWL